MSTAKKRKQWNKGYTEATTLPNIATPERILGLLVEIGEGTFDLGVSESYRDGFFHGACEIIAQHLPIVRSCYSKRRSDK